MSGCRTYFITWNAYGSWLPGDGRGWRKRNEGYQVPRPFLAEWCRDQMRAESVLLSEQDRRTVEAACREHCNFRGGSLLAVNARTHHVHLVVVVDASLKVVRDQLKANCTRRLRNQEPPLNVLQTWAKGADTEILDSDEEIESCITYVLEAQ